MNNKKSIIRVSIIIAIVAFLFILPVTVFSQYTLDEKAEDFGDRMDQWGEKMDEWGNDLEQALENGDVKPLPPLPFGDNYDNEYNVSPKLGAYIDDMDFEDAYKSCREVATT